VFPVLREDRNGSGSGREHKIYNNIFARCDKGGIVFLHEQNEAEGNIYAGMPERFAGLIVSDSTQWLDLATWRAHGWDLLGKIAKLEIEFDPERLELRISVQDGLQRVPVFNHLDIDMFGKTTGALRQPGPFAEFDMERVRKADPRHTLPAR
jgi:hypothetical protein